MADRGSTEPGLPVRVVIERTGLSADLLRAWERRYGAVRPRRSKGGQRLYSEQDVARLTLLRRATGDGHRIAEVARLDTTALETLVGDAPPQVAGANTAVEQLVAQALSATERLDAAALEAMLKGGALSLGTATLVDEVVSRFVVLVGERWHEGAVSPAHEHLATAVVRRTLDWVMDAHGVAPRAPRVVVATPAGERHELGAMLVAAAATQEGWRVVYLGASLPARDIARAARQVEARAVALSAVYIDTESAIEEVRAVARALPADTPLFVGGRTAQRVADRYRSVRIRVLPDMPALRRALRSLRSAGGSEAGGWAG
jgi:methanogenic corrinoid protein MtbC1